MNEAEEQKAQWSAFKWMVMTTCQVLGLTWILLSSTLLLATVLRAIVH